MRFIKGIFWNGWERRLRAGWRLFIQFILFAVLLSGQGALVLVLGQGDLTAFAWSILYLLGGLGQIWILARFIDRRRVKDFGFYISGAWWLDLTFGLFLGALLMSSVFAVEYFAGWVTVSARPQSSGLDLSRDFLLSVLIFVPIGINEEFTFRGYQLRNLAEGWSGRVVRPRVAILLAVFFSSALFGLAHFGNRNATLLSTINIVFGGLVLALPYVLTGELAIPIGIHITWNLFEGTVYGFPVSGTVPTRRLVNLEQTGPEMWTGGDFGPEGGLLALVWMVALAAAIMLWIKWRQKRVDLQERVAIYEPRSARDPSEGVQPAHRISVLVIPGQAR
jgi:membrane protease YdiL (CAAX protease family)